MKKKLQISIILLALPFICLSVLAGVQEDEWEDEAAVEGKHYLVNLSLYYPISINQSKHDSVNLNLSLIYGRVGYVRGIDLAGIAAIIEHRLQGVQIAGLMSVTGESGQGIQIAGLMSVSGNDFAGLQTSGLMSISGEQFKGAQFSGLMSIVGNRATLLQASGLASIVGEEATGGQISGGFNVVGNRFVGLQAAGLFNVTGEDCNGLQVGGLFNVAGGRLRGVQVGTFNVAAESRGVQIGVANIGGTSDGLQIGVVNYTKDENTGFPFGLVNLASNGHIRGVFWGGNSIAVTGGMKFVIGKFHSILSIGGFNLDDGINESLTYGFHYGMSFPMGRLVFNPDVGYRYRDNKSLFSNAQHPDQQIFELRLLLELPVSRHFSFVFGGGTQFKFDDKEALRDGRLYPLVIAGIEFY
ncbi:LA_2272 family surface repeat-containing protein [Acidobacteriota bacterium]